MCTLSLIPLRGSRPAAPGTTHATPPSGIWRLMVNRDEQRSRPNALPPRWVRCGSRRAIMPIDPASGGTWVGVNDAGLSAVILNATAPRPGPHIASAPELPPHAGSPPLSRGVIIPRLLAEDSLDQALNVALSLDAARWPRFRLLLADSSRLAVITSDGVALSTPGPLEIDEPLMLASSGLGDELVQRPRRADFESTVLAAFTSQDGAALSSAADATRRDEALCAAQDVFHLSHRAGAGATSVLMDRPDARTVSITRIELHPRGATITYCGVEEATRSPSPELQYVVPRTRSPSNPESRSEAAPCESHAANARSSAKADQTGVRV